MITKKNIYHTLAYKHMKAWCEGDKKLLKLLVKQFVDNRNDYTDTYASVPDKLKASDDLLSSFVWRFTPQGAAYWERIHYAQFKR